MRLERALVLAGARPEADPVAAYAGVSHKALIPLGGEPLLARVVAALTAAGVSRVAVASTRRSRRWRGAWAPRSCRRRRGPA